MSVSDWVKFHPETRTIKVVPDPGSCRDSTPMTIRVETRGELARMLDEQVRP